MQIITSPFLILYDKGEGLVAQLDILLLAKDEPGRRKNNEWKRKSLSSLYFIGVLTGAASSRKVSGSIRGYNERRFRGYHISQKEETGSTEENQKD
jgi:hypothetical protein